MSKKKSTKVTPARIFDSKKGQAHTAVDGFTNFRSRIGVNPAAGQNNLSSGFYSFNLITKNRMQLEAAYRGSWVVGRMIDCKAEDMTKAGVNITTNEDESDLGDLKSAMSRLQIWQSICFGLKVGDLYGGAIGLLQIEGQDLSTPLKIESIAEGQFQGIAVYDRWQLNPDLQNVIDSGPDIGLPKYYNIVNTSSPTGISITGQIKVHYSRLIRFEGIKLPYWQAIDEMMWGESVLERMWDRLISFDTATMSTANLIDKANLRMVGIDGLREIMAAGGAAQEGLEAQFDLMRRMQSNEGISIIDKNDEYSTTAYSFAGLDSVLLQFGQQLAGASETPLVRLFGQSPAGLSATGESDLRNYYDGINSKQESKLRNGVELILKVMWRSVFGKDAPKDMKFLFAPLWIMSTSDKSVIAKTNAETIIGAYENALIKKGVALKELREQAADTNVFTNISDEDIAEAEEEDENPPEPTELQPDPSAEMPKEPVKNLDAAPRTSIQKGLDRLFKRKVK